MKMKKTFKLFLALICLTVSMAFTSCEKNIIVEQPATTGLTINIDKSLLTRANTVNETINSITLISFTKDKQISSVQEFDASKLTGNLLSCYVRTDVTKLILITNAPAGVFKCNNYEQIVDVQLKLNNIMTSEKDVMLKPGKNQVDMTLTRLFSKIVLKNIEMDLKHNVSFKPTAIFLYNSNMASRIRTETQNETIWASGEDTAKENFIYKGFKTFNEEYDFICFNNPTKMATKLVIKGIFTEDGKPSTCYYPIVIGNGKGVIRNYLYELTARIKSKGVQDPSLNIDMSSLDINIIVTDYTKEETNTEM